MGSDEEDAGMTLAMVMVVVDDDCHVQRLNHYDVFSYASCVNT